MDGKNKLEQIRQSMDDLKQEYDEIMKKVKVVKTYVLPKPIDEMKEEMKNLLIMVKRK